MTCGSILAVATQATNVVETNRRDRVRVQ